MGKFNQGSKSCDEASRLVSLNILYIEKVCEKLASRRDEHKLIMLYKMISGPCPTCLSSLVPPTIGATVAFNLRNPNNTQTIHANSQLYFNFIQPTVIGKWRTLPEYAGNPHISSIQTLSNYKPESPSWLLHRNSSKVCM